MAPHKLTYKGVIQPPPRIERLVKRLTILMEVFDDEVQRLFKKRAKLPMYAEAMVLEHLEAPFELVANEPAAVTKDLSIVKIPMGAYTDAERPQVNTLVDAYCAQHRDELAALFEEHGIHSTAYRDNSDWLFTQPEVRPCA